ncbi:MAG: hypothetical protein ACOYBP_09065 [Microbacteriaceae bacterium]
MSDGALKQLNVKVPETLRRALKIAATSDDMSLEDMVTEALSQYLERRRRQKLVGLPGESDRCHALLLDLMKHYGATEGSIQLEDAGRDIFHHYIGPDTD